MRSFPRLLRLILPLLACTATLALGGVAGAQTITTFAGGGTLSGDGVPATDAVLNVPEGIAIDRNGPNEDASPQTQEGT